jgi:hypothetical protein
VERDVRREACEWPPAHATRLAFRRFPFLRASWRETSTGHASLAFPLASYSFLCSLWPWLGSTGVASPGRQFFYGVWQDQEKRSNQATARVMTSRMHLNLNLCRPIVQTPKDADHGIKNVFLWCRQMQVRVPKSTFPSTTGRLLVPSDLTILK